MAFTYVASKVGPVDWLSLLSSSKKHIMLHVCCLTVPVPPVARRPRFAKHKTQKVADREPQHLRFSIYDFAFFVLDVKSTKGRRPTVLTAGPQASQSVSSQHTGHLYRLTIFVGPGAGAILS